MDIEALAKKAGFTVANGSYGLKFSGGDFELLVRLATEEEREACAKCARNWPTSTRGQSVQRFGTADA
ncbi:MAG: hypothetical protein IPH08_11105 [Rhodocyclaceae bacterium]|nr:hypothetical protein [Rhodocyclaceae bacterium]